MFSSQKKDARLVQWNGRRRSSRSEEPMLPALWQRPVLLRLGIVLVTTLVVTFLAYQWGPPLPYRVGEVYPRDLRVRVDFEVVNEAQTEKAREDAVERLTPEEKADPVIRELARESVPAVVQQYTETMLLVPRGRPINDKQLTLL